MSIKRNIKRRMLMMMALAMTGAVLAAGTAQAQPVQPAQTTVTQTANPQVVVVGEPVTFHITVTNAASYYIPGGVALRAEVFDYLPAGVQFVSASASQGQCTYNPSQGENGIVDCDLGPLPPGGTVQIDVVVVPQEPGSYTNEMKAPFTSSTATVGVNAA